MFPNEKLQGFIGINGKNMATHTFPKVTLKVKYTRTDINRSNEYTRTITYNNGFAEKIIANINIDNRKMEENTDTISRAVVRMANYFDGCQVAPFDKLNILANRSLRNDIVDAIESKEKIESLTREETISHSLNISSQEETTDEK